MWPFDFCFKLPDHVSFDEGAMCEPLSVGVHAVTRANISLGQSILVTGSGLLIIYIFCCISIVTLGPIGLMSIMAAKAAGAGVIIAAGICEID